MISEMFRSFAPLFDLVIPLFVGSIILIGLMLLGLGLLNLLYGIFHGIKEMASDAMIEKKDKEFNRDYSIEEALKKGVIKKIK